MSSVTLTISEAFEIASEAFLACGASIVNAEETARALVRAETDGQKGHGLVRVPSYAAQLKSGKINPTATPTLQVLSDAMVAVDAHGGFAYPAIAMAVDELAQRAALGGIAAAFVRHSHHFGQAGAHAEALADRGLVGLVFGNSPKAMAFWGSNTPTMGTNPIAFAAPCPDGPPLVIDLALSVAARGKIVAAHRAGDSIPKDWALDASGSSTTDAAKALDGSLMPVGGAKGAALALMVEVLVAAMTGSHFGFEASSLFTPEGPAPNLGHVLFAIDPDKSSNGAYFSRMAVLLDRIEATDGARLPGTSRLTNRRVASAEGISVPEDLYEEVRGIANAA